MGWHEQAVEWAHKYMKMLGTHGPVPTIKLADNLGSDWLGITIFTFKEPWHTVIKYQKSIIDDPRTFERVAAHEMVHNHWYLNLTKEEIALKQAGIKSDGHGPKFFELAGKINAVMGKDFVTKTSDAEYVLAQTVKKYYLYLEPTNTGILYGWAVKLSPQAQRALARRISFRKGKLLEVNERRWTRCGGKIGATIGLCRADGEDLKALEQLYDHGKPSPFMMQLAPQSFNIRDLVKEEGRPLTELEKKILRRHGHEIPDDIRNMSTDQLAKELSEPAPPLKPPKPPEPKLHKFEPGAKQGKLF